MDYAQLFKNNFYLSKEWSELINSINGNISTINIRKKSIPIYKNKITLAWHRYSNLEIEELRNNKIIVTKITDSKKGLINYHVMFAQDYDEVYKNYDKKFRNLVKKSKEFKLKLNKETNFNSLYFIYLHTLKRLNSPAFPLKFFENALKLKEAKAFSVIYQGTKIAGCLIFENEDNVYLSFAFSLDNYFFTKPNNFLYDAIINYAMKNKKNLHFGMGVENAGYERFKDDTGAIKLKCNYLYKNEYLLGLGLKIVEKIPFLYKFKPNKILDVTIPFT
ncbi:MAG: hypothetical protein PHD81_02935 [Candidatus Nanoarchaeia archaeon]|nr:hypothetical protein [Candidatus Nanoarchaeia archaeon]MDD5588040.1 hypothetical protein [Candidatus Nanoarchaeia archaeon]